MMIVGTGGTGRVGWGGGWGTGGPGSGNGGVGSGNGDGGSGLGSRSMCSCSIFSKLFLCFFIGVYPSPRAGYVFSFTKSTADSRSLKRGLAKGILLIAA